MRKIMAVLIVIIVILGGYSYFVNRNVSLAKEREKKQKVAQIAAEKLEQEQAKLAEDREIQYQKQKKEQEAHQAEQTKKSSKEADEKKIEDLKKIIGTTLKDPDSSQFRGLFLNSSKTALCGEINAKNSYGGYVGFRPFIATANEAISWNGRKCDDSSAESRIECHREQLAYIRAATSNGCRTQEDINSQLLR